MTSSITDHERAELRELLAEQERRFGYKFNHWFPDEGAYRRELYPKHIAFFADGARYKERLFMAANRVGKSDSGAFDFTSLRDDGLFEKVHQCMGKLLADFVLRATDLDEFKGTGK